jgi:hypothetical protein
VIHICIGDFHTTISFDETMNAMNELKIGMLMGATIVGVICGLFPLGIAAGKNRPVLGFAFFFVAGAMGFLGGLILGMPTSFVLCGVAKLLPHKQFRPEDL